MDYLIAYLLLLPELGAIVHITYEKIEDQKI